LKIHNNKFSNNSGIAIQPQGLVFGVIYLNQFVNNSYDLKPLGTNSVAWANWPGPTNVGTNKYLYIEDNTSSETSTIIMSSGEGARWVYRFNTVTNHAPQGFDVHGDTLNRGVVAHELYKNTLSGRADYKGHDLKGGTGIVFNNKFNASGSSYEGRIEIVEQYSSCTNPGGCPNDNGGCGDEVNNSYVWNNINELKSIRLAVEESDPYNCIAAQVNYWTDTDGYNADTGYFTKGPFSARPASPAAQSVYWATDQGANWVGTGSPRGILYHAKTAGVWTQVYTPYDYPHPLRGESGDVTAPSVTITHIDGSANQSATYSTSSSTVTLAGTASDAVGVTSVTWVNNRGGSGSTTCTGCTGTSVTWSKTNITLYPGVNVITITATDGMNTNTDVLTVTFDNIPPFIDNLSPSGILTCVGTVTLTFTTDEVATAKYGTADTTYALLPNTFGVSGINHSQSVSVTCGQSYTYYIRTSDALGNVNTSSEVISFSVASQQIAGPGGFRIIGGRLTP
jgi:hypothetical protein